MLKPTVKDLDAGQLDLMWSFLMMGGQESNIEALEENLDLLRQVMIQKTAGQRKDDPKYYVGFDDIGTICNIIVCEAMALYLSGDLEKLKEIKKYKKSVDN